MAHDFVCGARNYFQGGSKTRISFDLELAKKGVKFGIYIDTVGVLGTNRKIQSL